MKRGTPKHPKTYKLAAELKIPLPFAVGILELLWHHAAQYTPRGDIGALPDEAIGFAVGWRKSPRKLIDALVKCNWLETDPTHRLVIHDWEDHAENSVRKHLGRTGKSFISGPARSLRSAVYFVRANPSGLIKIGFTEGHVENRLQQLQEDSSENLELIGSIAAPRAEETRLHRKFEHLRVKGEWFNPVPELINYVTECCSAGHPPVDDEFTHNGRQRQTTATTDGGESPPSRKATAKAKATVEGSGGVVVEELKPEVSLAKISRVDGQSFFERLIGAFLAAGVKLSEQRLMDAATAWVSVPESQWESAVLLAESKARTTSAQHMGWPANYLRKGDWTATGPGRILPIAREPTKFEHANEEAARNIRERGGMF